MNGNVAAQSGRTSLDNGQTVYHGGLINRIITGMTTFEELLTASVTPEIELQSTYGVTEIRDKSTVASGGTVTNSDSEYKLSSAAQTDSVARLETKERGRYLPGMEGMPGIAVRVPSPPSSAQVFRWGYFDDNNGFGIVYDSQGLATFIRRGGTDSIKRRSEWFDPLDGTGKSGATLDLTKVTIFRFPFRWYGSGPVAFQVSTIDSDGKGRIVTFNHNGAVSDTPFINTPNLPIRAEIENNSTATASDLFVLGRHYSVVGNFTPDFRVTHDLRTGQTVGTSGLTPLLGFRIKSGSEGISMRTGSFDIITNEDLYIVMLYGATLSNGSWVTPLNHNASETGVESNRSATTMSGGFQMYGAIANGGSPSSGAQRTKELPSFDFPWDGTEIVLAARAISTQATVSSILRVDEEW